MISFILIILGIWFLTRLLKNTGAPTIQPIKSTCPPHSWSWEKVYNEDGSFHHQHIVCAKCGPLHGIKDE